MRAGIGTGAVEKVKLERAKPFDATLINTTDLSRLIVPTENEHVTGEQDRTRAKCFCARFIRKIKFVVVARVKSDNDRLIRHFGRVRVENERILIDWAFVVGTGAPVWAAFLTWTLGQILHILAIAC